MTLRDDCPMCQLLDQHTIRCVPVGTSEWIGVDDAPTNRVGAIIYAQEKLRCPWIVLNGKLEPVAYGTHHLLLGANDDSTDWLP